MTFQYKNILPTIAILFIGCNANAAHQTPTDIAALPAAKGALPGAIGLSMDESPDTQAACLTSPGTDELSFTGIEKSRHSSHSIPLESRSSDASDNTRSTTSCSQASVVGDCCSVYSITPCSNSNPSGSALSVSPLKMTSIPVADEFSSSVKFSSLLLAPQSESTRIATPKAERSHFFEAETTSAGAGIAPSAPKGRTITPPGTPKAAPPLSAESAPSAGASTEIGAFSHSSTAIRSALSHMDADDVLGPTHPAHLFEGAYHEAHKFP